MNNRVKRYSQWFRGKDNVVADALSRDFHLNDKQLTNLLLLAVPTQMPSNFRISPLPEEIASWMTSLLLSLSKQTQLREEHTTSEIGRGDGGQTGVLPWASQLPFSIHTQKTNASHLSEDLPTPSDLGVSPNQLTDRWLRQQSRIPCHLWR